MTFIWRLYDVFDSAPALELNLKVCNRVKDYKGDQVADSHSIVGRWRNYFSQLFNVHGVKDVGQAETHTAEPLVTEPSAFGLSWLLAS